MAACSAAFNGPGDRSTASTSPTADVLTTSSSVPSDTTSSTIADTSTTTATIATLDTGDVVGFEVINLTVGGEALLVAVADTALKRGQGLMLVEDLGDLDGMVFVFPTDVINRFWMKDTPLPLDIAFFSADGTLVDLFEMVPCETDSCPRYQPAGAYRYAIERPAGSMVGVLTPSDLLDVSGLGGES